MEVESVLRNPILLLDENESRALWSLVGFLRVEICRLNELNKESERSKIE